MIMRMKIITFSVSKLSNSRLIRPGFKKKQINWFLRYTEKYHLFCWDFLMNCHYRCSLAGFCVLRDISITWATNCISCIHALYYTQETRAKIGYFSFIFAFHHPHFGEPCFPMSFIIFVIFCVIHDQYKLILITSVNSLTYTLHYTTCISCNTKNSILSGQVGFPKLVSSKAKAGKTLFGPI